MTGEFALLYSWEHGIYILNIEHNEWGQGSGEGRKPPVYSCLPLLVLEA